MQPKSPLTDADYKRVSANIRDLQAIRDDIQRAKAAGVPGMDDLHNLCTDCENRNILIKKHYFPHKP